MSIEWTFWEDDRYPQYRALLPTGFVYIGKKEADGPWLLRGEGVDRLGTFRLTSEEGHEAVREASDLLAEELHKWAERLWNPPTFTTRKYG